MNKGFRPIIIIIAVITCIFAFAYMLGPQFSAIGGQAPKQFSIGELYNAIETKQIAKATWSDNSISGTTVDGSKFEATVPTPNSSGAAEIVKEIGNYRAPITTEKSPVGQVFMNFLGIIAVPLIFIGALWFLLIRPAQMGGNQALSFGKSRAKRAGDMNVKVTFADVAGIDEAKQELYEIVDFLKNTKKYSALGAKIPKGILLTGPPGVGKTHLSRAIAGEAGVPFFHISGSDFVEMFVGVGAARVRDLFETAKAHRPALIFIDEIDAVGRQRGAGLGGGHDEREQTLNQLLVEMDGFDSNSGIILIAATNRPDVLDPALLRPGRFDRQVVVDLPDANGREAILKIHSKGKPIAPEINFENIARRTVGFTGADLANALNESAILAARRNAWKIESIDIDEALDRVMAGPQRKSRIIDDKEKELLAYHEAGHAVVGEVCSKKDPVHKVTILPRGYSLGATWYLPAKDKFTESKQDLIDQITTALGGRVAEEIVYGDVNTGATSDLRQVGSIARAMVCEYGMSDKLGSIAFGKRGRNPFLGRDYYEERNYSEQVAAQIDEEIHLIVESCHQRARQILEENRDKMDRVVQALLVRETLNREEFLAAMAGTELPEPTPSHPAFTGELDSGNSQPTPQTGNTPQSAPPRFEPGPA